MRRGTSDRNVVIANKHLFGYQTFIHAIGDATGEMLMKTARNLTYLLCSAASLAAIGGAQAADLPLKAKAVEYVRVCSLYGAGFFYIPGTDTCIKLGGYLRVETALNTNSVFSGAYNGAAGAQNRYRNYCTARSREDLN